MPDHLTPDQRSWLEADLTARQRQLDTRLAAHHEGASRVEHAHDWLGQDEESSGRHAADREVDLALSDLDTQELGAVSRALQRLREGRAYGACTDCGTAIPFERLRVEPQAERCVDCAERREKTR